MRSTIYLCITAMILLIASYMVFNFPPPVAEQVRTHPAIYRAFFIHFASAITSYVAFALTFVGSILYLSKKDLKWDRLSSSSAEVGLVLCAVVLITGSIWASLEWGSPWHWDPIETTTLVVFLAYVAYVGFRMSIEEIEKRARLSSIVGILAFVTIPINYASIRLPIFGPSLLPQVTYGPATRATQITTLIGVLLLALYLIYLTMKTEELSMHLGILRGEE